MLPVWGRRLLLEFARPDPSAVVAYCNDDPPREASTQLGTGLEGVGDRRIRIERPLQALNEDVFHPVPVPFHVDLHCGVAQLAGELGGFNWSSQRFADGITLIASAVANQSRL